MADLIVDFPRKPRGTISSANTIDTKDERRRTSKCLRFSEISTMAVFERSSREEMKLKWYSKVEADSMKRQFYNEVFKAWEELKSTPMDKISHDSLLGYVGMEVHLSPDLYSSTIQRRANHVNLILGAQERQKMMHVRDEEELSVLSQRSSEWICWRANCIASKYWEVLGE